MAEFDDVIVVDSNSIDDTVHIAHSNGASVLPYQWNAQYPKKRQWCLENIQIKHNFIFFLDADEAVTPNFIEEIKKVSFDKAGYFIRGTYVWQNKILKHGLMNNKLALFDKNKIEFPIIDDLEIKGMGEIEGHYQPVLKSKFKQEKIGQMRAPILHYAYEEHWEERHQGYANWEAEMIEGCFYPQDPNLLREILKRIFRKMPARGLIAFLHSYLYKRGFLDGKAGYDFAKSRKKYYDLVAHARKEKRLKCQ